MIKPTLPSTSRRRRVLWLGCFVCLAWVTVRWIPAAVHDVREARWSLKSRMAMLVRSREELGAAAGLEDSATMLKTTLAAQVTRVVTSGNEAQANDALTGLVSTVIANTNAKLNRTERVTDSTARGYLRRVTLLVSFESDIGGTIAVLRALAEELPVINIGSVTIMAADPNAPRSEPEVLTVELEVLGWYLANEGI